jgi:phosphate starvation-inducible PhoH-like protein
MEQKRASRDVQFNSNEHAGTLYGDLNKNIQLIEDGARVHINVRGAALKVSGAEHDVSLAVNLLEQLYGLISTGYPIYTSDVAFGLKILQGNPSARLERIFLDKVFVTARNRVISPKTPNQKLYIDAIRGHDIVFGIGPAGTGKTYLAVAMAVAALADNMVRTIILTRPAVEAGERLGFLPGDLTQKVDPYLRPLNDALLDMLGIEKAQDLLDQGIIEIAPLAFMRGRTLSNAFVILDEAQNTTREQMKMFLTRIGFDSRAVITGDITQIDLPSRGKSGLIQAADLLGAIDGISFCRFTKKDVVRHPLVQKIIQAYEGDVQPDETDPYP